MDILGNLHMYITAGSHFMTIYQHCGHRVNRSYRFQIYQY